MRSACLKDICEKKHPKNKFSKSIQNKDLCTKNCEKRDLIVWTCKNYEIGYTVGELRHPQSVAFLIPVFGPL